MNDRFAAPENRSINILCFIHSFDPGGVERIALRLCREWRQRGAEVTLAVGTPRGRLEHEVRGTPVMSTSVWWFPQRCLETLWMMFWLPRVIRRVNPDLLYCPGNTYTIVAVTMKLLLGMRCPPIVAKVSNDLRRKDLPGLVRAIYHLWCRLQGRWIDHFVGMSESMRSETIRSMQVDASRVSTIFDPVLDDIQHNRLRAAAERRHPLAPGSVCFLAISRLVRQKNLPLLIEAFVRARSSGDTLTIVGDGPMRATLRALIDTHGVADRVRMVGYVDDVTPYLEAADVFVISSLYEGVPAVIVEALAAGLRLIATDCCATMKSITQLAGGKLVPTGDARRLAEAIVSVQTYIPNVQSIARFVQPHVAGVSATAYLELFGHLESTSS